MTPRHALELAGQGLMPLVLLGAILMIAIGGRPPIGPTCQVFTTLTCTGVTGPEINYMVPFNGGTLQYDQIIATGVTITTWCPPSNETCGPLGITQFIHLGQPVILRPLGATQ
jgi:hypothetical protein